jgi:ribosome-binding protein aMBF1 (putative translation factor)
MAGTARVARHAHVPAVSEAVRLHHAPMLDAISPARGSAHHSLAMTDLQAFCSKSKHKAHDRGEWKVETIRRLIWRHDDRSLSRQDAGVNPDELDALIAGRVRAARARARMRQEDLADELGWSRPVVGTLEAGTRRVTLADAVLLCRALDITLNELLQGAPNEVFRSLGLTETQ